MTDASIRRQSDAWMCRCGDVLRPREDDGVNAQPNNCDVIVSLSQDEALVLLDWLAVFNKSEQAFSDQAAQRVLWDVEAMLERSVDVVFSDGYERLLAEARARVRDATD